MSLFINIDTHYLPAYTPGQVVHVYVSGGEEVAGLNLNISTDAGTITHLDALSGIFAGGNATVPGDTGIYDEGHLGIVYVATVAGSVPASGLVATVWLDTGAPGLFSFDFVDTLNGPTEFIAWPSVEVLIPTQGDMTVQVASVPEPSALALLGLGGLLILRKGRR